MEAAGELLTIAELAIGLAGFSGVVVAFAHRNGLREDDRFYFVALLFSAFSAVLVAFVPMVFHHAGLAGPALWMASSTVALIVGVVLGASMLVRARGIVWQPIGNSYAVAQFVVVFALVLSQILNLIGWPMEPGPALYVVGLLLWLAAAGMVFALLVLVGAQE